MRCAAVGTAAGRLCGDECCSGGGCAGADGFCIGGFCKGVFGADGFCAGGFWVGAFCAGTHCADVVGMGEGVTDVVAGEDGDAGGMEHMWFTHLYVVCNTAT